MLFISFPCPSIFWDVYLQLSAQVIEKVLNSHDNKIDDAIKSLHALCIGNGSIDIDGANVTLQSSDKVVEG